MLARVARTAESIFRMDGKPSTYFRNVLDDALRLCFSSHRHEQRGRTVNAQPLGAPSPSDLSSALEECLATFENIRSELYMAARIVRVAKQRIVEQADDLKRLEARVAFLEQRERAHLRQWEPET